MDNKDNRNKMSNEVEQHYDNKKKLKVDKQIKLQKKCTEQVKPQDSPCSSTNYKGVSMVRFFQIHVILKFG
jgi:hypothetical protein